MGTPRSLGTWSLGSWAGFSALALVCSLGACSDRGADAPFGRTSALPVTRVVLYQNGVGYFERAGTLEDHLLELQVRPSQINDLLKSLTVVESGTGRVVSASLPLEQSADRLLSELPEQVRQAGGLLQVLSLFRGARVDVDAGSAGSATGRVIGVEDLAQGGDETDLRVALKTDDDRVLSLPVEKVSSVTLHDRTLSVGLDRSLDVSLGEGGWKPIRLSIRLAGPSPHRVLVSYVVEMPRWKPAYRLVLGEGQQPLFQGFAVVDNVSGEHWQDVALSLVSGTPISFRYNLHAPQYTERADLTPRHLPRAVAPPPGEAAGYADDEAEAVEEEESYAAEDTFEPSPLRAKKSKAGRSRPGALGGAMRSESAAAPMAPPPPSAQPAPDLLAIERQGAQAEANRVGALFRYDVRDRVTIPDRSSTLVNVINQRIEGEQVAYFRPELSGTGRDSHPYRAVKFDNATGFTLERGPIVVYADGTFVGEGFVERMEKGQTAFLTFAIDAQVLLDQKGGMREESFRLLRIVDGQLLTEARRVMHTSYEVKNHREEAVRSFIRTPRQPGWTLRDRREGTVEMPDALVVPLDVPAAGKATLEVEWEQPMERRVAIASNDATELLQVYLDGGKAPPELRKVIEQLLSIKAELSDERKSLSVVDRQHASLSRDVSRVRDNLNVLRKTQGNRALELELAQKLAKLERELGQLSGQRVSMTEHIAELEKKLTQLIRGVNLSP